MTIQQPAQGKLRRELGLRDTTLFAITTIVGTRWLVAATHAGSGSLSFWLVAALFLAVPLAFVVAAMTVKYPGEPGFYRWTCRDFGEWHGFLCFWTYWLGMAVWFPSAAVFYMSAGLYSFEPSHAESRIVLLVTSLAAIWIALLTNLVGLRIGKWTQNAGGTAVWLLGGVLIASAAFVWVRRGSATPLDPMPVWNWSTVSFWGSMIYAVSGLELASLMGAEIRDPERTLPRAGWIASGICSVYYCAVTAAMLVLVSPSAITELKGLAQAGQAASSVLAQGWLAPLVGTLVVLSAVGQIGGIGTSVSRLPFTVGADRHLPGAFARVHPRWGTPHVSIVVLGLVASVLLIAAQVGDTLRGAYQTLVSLMMIAGFLPYLYIFASGWKAGRRWSAAAGFAASLFAIASACVPTAEVGNVPAFEAKLVLGTAGVILSARAVYRRYRPARGPSG